MKKELEALELRFANGEITEAEYQSEKELLLDSMSIDDWLDGKIGIELPGYAESILSTLQPHQEPNDFESLFQEVSRGPIVDQGKEDSDLEDDLFMDIFSSVETGPLAAQRDESFRDDSAEPLQFEGQIRQDDRSMVSIEQSDYSTAVESWLDGNYAEGLPEGLANTLTTLQAKVEPSDFETVFAEVSNGPLSDVINVEDVDDNRDLFLDVLSKVEMGPLASRRQSFENEETSAERAAGLLLSSVTDTFEQANKTSTSAESATNNVIDWTKVLQVSIPSLAAAAALIVILPGSQNSQSEGLPESDASSPAIEIMAYRSVKPTVSELEMQMEILKLGSDPLDDELLNKVEQRYIDLGLEYQDTTDWGLRVLSVAELHQIQLAIVLGLKGAEDDSRLPNILQTARYNVQKLNIRSDRFTLEENLKQARSGNIGDSTPKVPAYLDLGKLSNQVLQILQQEAAAVKRMHSIANGQIPAKTQLEANRAKQLQLLLIELNISLDDLGEE